MLLYHPARPQPESMLRLLFPPSFPLFLPPPAPLASTLRHPSLSAATDRESNILQLPAPAVLLLPSFFIKFLKQQSVAAVVR